MQNDSVNEHIVTEGVIQWQEQKNKTNDNDGENKTSHGKDETTIKIQWIH